jgi:HPt (histidine-containing phosphotransfer) domain-containing protein
VRHAETVVWTCCSAGAHLAAALNAEQPALTFAVQFARAVAAGDFAAAEQEARTLKTSAAERGADGLRAAAEQLETACRERTAADWQGMLDAVRREARASEPEAVTEIARRLQDLLRQSDSRAGELAEELATVAARFGEEARFRPVLEAVAAYEFDAALSALRAAVALSA